MAIKLCKNHPSPEVQESIKEFTDDDISKAIDKLQDICKELDGYRAFKTIGAFNKNYVSGILKLYKENNL
jgi:hypothetical protein